MDVPKSMLTHVEHLIWLTECFISLVKRVKQGHQDVDDDSEVESYARPSEHLTSNGVLDSLCCGGEGKEGDAYVVTLTVAVLAVGLCDT